MSPQLAELIAEFESSGTARNPSFKEDWARSDYIEPLFGLLGWTRAKPGQLTSRTTGYVREVDQKVAGGLGTKAPDYGFYVDGRRVMYAEAKKPAVRIKAAQGPAFQLRRYGWNAAHPIGLLTDFEEFAVYDCRVQPSPSDPATTALIDYLTVGDYVARWSWLQDVFSPDAVRLGSLRRLAGEAVRKKTRPVDAAFLDEIESWRLVLAEDIVKRQRGLPPTDLAFSVQAIIDRLIFLRIAEARGLEEPGTLDQIAAATSDLYRRLQEVFERADRRYNSGLFHFRRDTRKVAPDRLTPSLEVGDAVITRKVAPDRLTPSLEVGDAVIRTILRRLSPTSSPYEFSVMPPDILGQVYERFLGNRITVTSRDQVAVQPKPEVRKAGGVYYTPAFVVDYIVEATLAQLLRGMSVAQVAELRIVDPACGSGSFLISAYQYLLDWHLDRFAAAPARFRRQLRRGSDGEWRLSLEARKRILLNSIYGVDIDPQAVEVAKLSLLLKVIEGETQLALAVEQLLPDLDSNIVRGNSLIGMDFYDGRSEPLNPDEMQDVYPFSWAAAFPKVFAAKGFDAVIGNPPYLSIDDTWGSRDVRLSYLKRAFPEVYNDKTDILFYFLKRAVDLSRGEIAFIVSRAFLEAFKADKLRGWLSGQVNIREVVDFQNAYVFEGVGITTAIVRLTKRRTGPAKVRKYLPLAIPPGTNALAKRATQTFATVSVKQSEFSDAPWIFTDDTTSALIEKIDKAGTPVGDILTAGQGMQTGANSVFGHRTVEELREWRVAASQTFIRARNSDIQKFRVRDSGERLLYLEKVKKFADLPEGVKEHLTKHKVTLRGRAAFRRGNCEWWRYTWPLHSELLSRPRILCPYLAVDNRFAWDRDNRFLGLTDTTVLFDAGQPEDLRYIVAVLNSSVLSFRFLFIGKLKSDNIREYFAHTVGQLPIPRVDPEDPRVERLIHLAEGACSVLSDRDNATTPAVAAAHETQARGILSQIDEIVYDLFGIDDEGIRTIETALSAVRSAGESSG